MPEGACKDTTPKDTHWAMWPINEDVATSSNDEHVFSCNYKLDLYTICDIDAHAQTRHELSEGFSAGAVMRKVGFFGSSV